jgi:hypothetical protein
MNFDYDHERFVAKNKSLASAEEINKKDAHLEKKGFSHLKRNQEGSCFNCKMKQGCSEFKSKKSGGSSGVVSFGGDEQFVCSRYIPAASSDKSMSSKQIKSLLKNVKNGH